MIRSDEFKGMLEKLYAEGVLTRPVNQALDFPIYDMPPLLYAAVRDVIEQCKAPASSTACMLLCALSASLQGVTRVQKLPGMISPIGMAIIVSLPSGERKSSIARLLFSGIRDYDSAEFIRATEESNALPMKREVWHAIKRGLLNAIQRAPQEGSEIQLYEEKLKQHALLEPKKAPIFRALFEKASIAALTKHLAENAPVTTLFSDEALTQLAGSSSQDFGLLNRLLDGDTFRTDLHGNSLQIDEPALTFGLWGQNNVIDDFMLGKKSQARDSGFIARCYFIKPSPTSGTRHLEVQQEPESYEALNLFNQFCKHCLELTKSSAIGTSNGDGKITLIFSPEARVLWHQYYNNIEYEIAQRGQASLFPDLSSKQADKVARIAALFHCIESDGEIISYESMQRAIKIGEALFRGTMFFLNNAIGDEIAQRGKLLFDWLTNYVSNMQEKCISRTALMQFGPPELRSKESLRPVLTYLANLGQIWVGSRPDRGKAVYVWLIQPPQSFIRT